jgi:hypothetical protein
MKQQLKRSRAEFHIVIADDPALEIWLLSLRIVGYCSGKEVSNAGNLRARRAIQEREAWFSFALRRVVIALAVGEEHSGDA